MSGKVNRCIPLTVGMLAAVIMLIPTAAEGEWTYTYFKDVRPLTTLDTYRIAVLDPTPSPLTSSARLIELRARQKGGVPSKAPAGDLGNGWVFLDLTGTPSAGDPEAVAALAEEIANDPAGDEFVSLIFLFGDQAAFVTPRIHVGFQDGVSLATVQQILGDAGVGDILKSDWIRPNIFIADAGTRSGTAALNAANALAQLPEVYFAAVDWGLTGESLTQAVVEYPPESILATSATTNLSAPPRKDAPAPLCGPLGVAVPNDPFLLLSWGLEYYNNLDVDAYEAWQVCTGSPSVMAAVLGDGVPLDHPDMPNVLPGADFTSQCESPPCQGQPQTSCDMHETAVASIIHAAANNGIASSGVAPDVSILPIRVGWYWVSGSTCIGQLYQSTLADGIDYAVAQGAVVTNLSWNYSVQLSPILEIAYRNAYETGVVNFNSAGNANQANVFEPGKLFEVHSISGIDSTGMLFHVTDTYASNWGPDVDFTGPGRHVFALDRVGPDGYEDETGPYGADAVSLTGTSFACPHIAGVAALILARNPALGPEEVFYLLRETALDLGDPGRDDFFGYGICKAAAAVALASDVIAIRTFDRGDLTGWLLVIE